MKEGIKAQQRIWTNLKIKKSDEKNEGVQSALSPDQIDYLRAAKKKLPKWKLKFWDDLIDAMDITD